MTRAQVWVVEVGLRAALHSESGVRDERWWLGLWDRTERARKVARYYR